MVDKVRVAPLLRACMEVLRDSTDTLTRNQVMDLVERRVPLSEYEQATFDDTGRMRWRNVLGWYAGDAATIGWMSKRGGHWSITEAGESALETFDEDALCEELRRRYAKVRRLRMRAVEELSGVEQFIARALNAVDSGGWTAYEDVSALVGAPADKVAHFLAGSQKAVPGAYRVLHEDGSLPSEGQLHMAHRSMNLMQKLAGEGVEFDDQGRASQEQRMTAKAIKERLFELDVTEFTGPRTRRAWLIRGSSVVGENIVRQWIPRGVRFVGSQRTPPDFATIVPRRTQVDCRSRLPARVICGTGNEVGRVRRVLQWDQGGRLPADHFGRRSIPRPSHRRRLLHEITGSAVQPAPQRKVDQRRLAGHHG